MTIGEVIRNNTHFRESRLQSLYSNFQHLKDLNPDGYEANIVAWRLVLYELLQQKQFAHVLCIPTHNPRLAQALALPVYSEPDALPTIVAELVADNLLIPYSQYQLSTVPYEQVLRPSSFLHYLSPASWVKWASKFSPLEQGALKEEHYLAWDILKPSCETIFKRLVKATDDGTHSSRLFDRKTLLEEIRRIEDGFTDLDLSIFIIFFTRDVPRITVSEDYIKLDDSPITAEDIGIVNIKANIRSLTKRTEALQHKIAEIPPRVKACLSDKPRAKSLLALKRTYSQSLDTASATLHQLTTVLVKIDDAYSNTSVVEALERSLGILKELNSKVDLDHIDEVKEELDEQIARTDEVGELLGESSVNVDEEFEQMLAEEKREEKEKKREDDLLDKLQNLDINEVKSKKAEETRSESEPREAEPEKQKPLQAVPN